MQKLFPLIIITLVVAMISPMLTGYIGGMTEAAAARLATQIESAGN